MNAEQIVSTILIRDHFRYVRMNYAVRIFSCLILLLAFSVAGNVGLATSTVKFRYLMTKPDGRLMTLVPLQRPNMDDSEVAKWTVDSVTRVNTFDFANYRQQFSFAQTILTGIGWEGYEKALKDSGNFVAVLEGRYVTTAVPTGPATVVNLGLARGADGSERYMWQVNFPMVITYRSSVRSTSQDLSVSVTVVRMPEFINPSGLGIRQIVAR
jgi:hypothetical protein